MSIRRWFAALPFILGHIAALGAYFVEGGASAWALCIALYVVRMWAVTAGYHRYFSHRSFKTSRAFQFVLAVLAQSSVQKGALWWAARHRHHHKHSDDTQDVHSPVHHGFVHSHVGWLFDPASEETDLARVRDLARYPELRWLNRYHLVPAIALAILCYALLDMSGLFIGFFLSTVFLWHGTFLINSLAHVFGRRRYETKDDSRNSAILALITLGEGWHNNHHRYPSAARNGFFPGEFDPTYAVLCLLARIGIVWDLRDVPERILDEGRNTQSSTKKPPRRSLPTKGRLARVSDPSSSMR